METLTFKTFLLISGNLQLSRGFKNMCPEGFLSGGALRIVWTKCYHGRKEEGRHGWKASRRRGYFHGGLEGRGLDYDGVEGGEGWAVRRQVALVASRS